MSPTRKKRGFYRQYKSGYPKSTFRRLFENKVVTPSEYSNEVLETSYEAVFNNGTKQNHAENGPVTVPDPSSRSNESNESDAFDFSCLSKELYDKCPVTLLQAVLLLQAFILSASLSKNNVQHLLDILLLLIPSPSLLPETVYKLEKIVTLGAFNYCFYCPDCSGNTQKSSNDRVQCKDCNKEFEESVLKEKKSYFLHWPLEVQLRTLLQDLGLGKSLDCPIKNGRNSFNWNDISDGHLYRTFQGGILKNSNENCISLTMNTDGVPIFQSSNFSMWPVQVFINELPPWLRYKNIIVTALWTGYGKPNLQLILESFVNEVTTLSKAGFQWLKTTASGTHMITTKVFLAMCSVDSVARADIQGLKLCTGHFGCSWCTIKGLRLKKGKGTVQCYPYIESEKLNNRDSSDFPRTRTGVDASTKFINGIVRTSPLIGISNFDIVRGCVVDIMHCIDLGVCRQLCALWFDSVNHTEEWYIGMPAKVKAVNEKMLQIQPPSNVKRLPRSLNERAHWKASEWHNFLLYYGLIVLRNILLEPYLSHFALLSQAIFIMIEPGITQLKLHVADDLLQKFVKTFGELYGENNMKFNAHQLLHLTECVANWGPAGAYSTYPFEDNNGLLLKLFNGTQHVDKQIMKRLMIRSFMKNAIAYENGPNFDHGVSAISLASKIIGLPVDSQVSEELQGNFCFIGKERLSTLNQEERVACEPFCDDQQMFSHFKKVSFNGHVFSILDTESTLRRQNCYVLTKEKDILEIKKIVRLNNKGNGALIIGRKVFVRQLLEQTGHIVDVERFSSWITAIDVGHIVSKCIAFYNVYGGSLISLGLMSKSCHVN